MEQKRRRTNASTGMDHDALSSHAANPHPERRRRRHRSVGSSVAPVIQTDLSVPPGWLPHLFLSQYGGPEPDMLPPPLKHSPSASLRSFHSDLSSIARPMSADHNFETGHVGKKKKTKNPFVRMTHKVQKTIHPKAKERRATSLPPAGPEGSTNNQGTGIQEASTAQYEPIPRGSQMANYWPMLAAQSTPDSILDTRSVASPSQSGQTQEASLSPDLYKIEEPSSESDVEHNRIVVADVHNTSVSPIDGRHNLKKKRRHIHREMLPNDPSNTRDSDVVDGKKHHGHRKKKHHSHHRASPDVSMILGAETIGIPQKPSQEYLLGPTVGTPRTTEYGSIFPNQPMPMPASMIKYWDQCNGDGTTKIRQYGTLLMAASGVALVTLVFSISAIQFTLDEFVDIPRASYPLSFVAFASPGLVISPLFSSQV